MRTSRTLHVLGVAALSLAVARSGGAVHARGAPSQPLSAAAIGQAACSGATQPRMRRAATFKAEVFLDRLDISPGIIDGKTGENGGRRSLPSSAHVVWRRALEGSDRLP